MADGYETGATRQVTYISKSGKVIRGYEVEFVLTDFDEEHSVNVPDLKPETVKAAIETILKQRRGVADL